MRREFAVLAEGRHIFGGRPKPRAATRGSLYKDLTETGNRARKVSGTQGNKRQATYKKAAVVFLLLWFLPGPLSKLPISNISVA